MSHMGREGYLNGESYFDRFLTLARRAARIKGVFMAIYPALTFGKDAIGHLLTVIREPALSQVILNGSDYPLPRCQTPEPAEGVWQRLAPSPKDERKALDQVLDQNPLLFDFGRQTHHPRSSHRQQASLTHYFSVD